MYLRQEFLSAYLSTQLDEMMESEAGVTETPWMPWSLRLNGLC